MGNCDCPIPCESTHYGHTVSSAALSNAFVAGELKRGAEDPKFQAVVSQSRLVCAVNTWYQPLVRP